MGPGLILQATVCILAATIVAAAAPSSAQDVSKPNVPDSSLATVSISITNRNGSAYLATFLQRLKTLSQTDEFRQYLSRTVVEDDWKSCPANARPDPSGRTFDLARCTKIWPYEDKAPASKVFEQTFRKDISSRGVLAFPDARVTTFTFQLKLAPKDLPVKSVHNRSTKDDAGHKIITDDLKTYLCNPKVTFVDRSSCQAKIINRPGIYENDFAVTQTGYYLEVGEPLPVEDATKLRDDLLKEANKLGTIPSGSFNIYVSPVQSKSSPEQAQLQPSPTGDTYGSRMQKIWTYLGAGSEDLDITQAQTPPAAPLFVFDNTVQDSVPFDDWINSARTGVHALASNCTGGPAASDHMDAVGSVLMTRRVAELMSPQSGGTGDTDPSGAPVNFAGYFMNDSIFTGGNKFVDGQQFLADLSGDDGSPEHARIVLAVYSNRETQYIPGYTENIVNTYLSSKDNILIVSAAQQLDLQQSGNYSTNINPTDDSHVLSDICVNKSFPSCLGSHPRVIVVAPSSMGGADAQMALTTTFALGASAVKLSAPGENVPYVASCEASPGGDGSHWTVKQETGSSFAAPQVALLLEKLFQIGPADLATGADEAVWRVLATADPTPNLANGQALVQFGQINVGRALTGADRATVGPENASQVYLHAPNGGEQPPKTLVVMPYPWSDVTRNLDTARGIHTAKNGTIFNSSRGSLTFISYDKPIPDVHDVAFNNIFRIVRKPNVRADGSLLFDIYYVTRSSSTAPFDLSVARDVTIGSRDNIPTNEGYCNTGPVGGKALGEALPACLYVWDGTAGSAFVPLALDSIDEIVLPPAPIDAQSPGQVSYTDMASIFKAGSPWISAFCKSGPRKAAAKFIYGYSPQKMEAMCQSTVK